MTTFALVGAGPGLGLAAARRFGTAGHHVALISRSAQHQDNLVAELGRAGRTSTPAASPPTSSTPTPSPPPCAKPPTRWDRSRSSSSARRPVVTS